MKSIFLYSFVMLLLARDVDHVVTEFPKPPISGKTLFYIQRSTNTNTVLYELNLLEDKSINPTEPVQVYWLRYAEKGQKRDLNLLERNVAYGVKCSHQNNGQYMMRFVASKTKWAEVFMDAGGQAHAMMSIDNKKSKLTKIFVQVAEDGWWPKIDYIEFFGVEKGTEVPTYEKMKI